MQVQPQSKSRPTGSFFTRLSYFLKATFLFFPGIIFLLLGLFAFINLPQGKDIIYQSTDGNNSWVTGLYLVLATIFWVFTTWYTARLIAYDRNDLYKTASWVLFHFPRLLGYCIFLVLWLAVFLIDDIKSKLTVWAWVAAIIDILVIYIFFYGYVDRSLNRQISKQRWKRLNIIRNIVRVLILLSCIIVIVEWGNKNIRVLLYTLPVFQLGFLFLVIVRHPMYKYNPKPRKTAALNTGSWQGKYLAWTFSGSSATLDRRFEKPIFIIYHILALIAFFSYLMAINYLPFARELTSFPLVLLAFGILLGFINFLALASHRKNINFNFLVIALIIGAGFFFDIHPVRTKKSKDPSQQSYAGRPAFRQYLESWIRWHKKAIDSSAHYPVFFTLADGGASRSGYWAALVLGRMHEKTRYNNSSNSFFSDHLFCLSGASGGSVGNTSFLSALKIQRQHPELKTDSISVKYLDNDFLSFSLARLLGPDVIKPVFGMVRNWGDRAAALELAMEHPADEKSYMGGIMRDDFGQFIPSDQNQYPIICINTTRVNDGGPGVVSTVRIDSAIFGQRIDVLKMVPKGRFIRTSTAMALGARFPYMSPGGKLGDSYFVDGGYFDNSGAGVVHEMLLELNRIAIDSTDSLSKIVKKFQFYVLHFSNTPYVIPDSTHRIHPTLNDLATPLLTLAGSYNSQTSINDARLINYLKELNKERNSYIIINLYQRGVAESIPMNWVISNRVRTVMFDRVTKKPAVDTIAARLNRNINDNLFRDLKQKN